MITSNEERSWPIDLFRYNESTGWEREIGGDKEGIATMTSARKGSIVIHSLQQKFSIAATTTSTTTNRNEQGSDSSVGKATIIRRDRCILMLSRSRVKAMVLRFFTLQDCLDFSDRFIELNPFDGGENDNSNDVDDDVDDDVDVLADRHHPLQIMGGQGLEADHEMVTAHLIRLMHEPTFTEFVHNVEVAINSSEDGTRLLESWAERDPQY